MTLITDTPPGGFDIIVADPPWKFASNSAAKPGRNAMRHYPCMPTKDIAAMPVELTSAKHALLFLWATSPMLPQALDVMGAWGFKYISSAVWVKTRLGTGYWFRNRHEILLLGKRGKFPRGAKAPFKTSIIEGEFRGHSRKPSQLQDRIDEIWPTQAKLEMFARQRRLGWAAHGNEVPDGD